MISVALVPLPLFVVLFRAVRVEESEPGAARLVARVGADGPEPFKSDPSSRAPRFLFEPAVAL